MSNHRPKSKQPPLKLVKPRTPGSGLKSAVALVTVFVLVTWLLGNLGSNRSNQAPASNGAAAADQVEQLSRQLSERTRDREVQKMLPMAGGTVRSLALNGVPFKVATPAGWAVSEGKTQLFLRKGGDPRICQLGADNAYDVQGLIADVRGKESEFEAAFVKQGIQAAVPKGAAKVETAGLLLASNYGATLASYTVKILAKMTVGGNSIEQMGVNSTFASGKLMVRLQCMNMSGPSDESGDMETMGRSLTVQAT